MIIGVAMLWGASQMAFSQAQNCHLLKKFSPQEQERLQTDKGCGCSFYDVNECGYGFYLVDEHMSETPKDYLFPTIYAKIGGRTERFSLVGKEYRIRFTGQPEPVFDLFFSQKPTEKAIQREIWQTAELHATKDRTHPEAWNTKDGLQIFQDPTDEYYLFRSNNYFIRLYEYKKGSGVEARVMKGELFLYQKNGEEISASFFTLVCGC